MNEKTGDDATVRDHQSEILDKIESGQLPRTQKLLGAVSELLQEREFVVPEEMKRVCLINSRMGMVSSLEIEATCRLYSIELTPREVDFIHKLRSHGNGKHNNSG